MNKVVFTIVAKNYIGLANVLARSIARANNSVDFYVFIADEPEGEIEPNGLDITYLVAKDTVDISAEKWTEMSFKYDLTEFCTSIKPACFKYLIDRNPDAKIIYFDPDIMVYNSLDSIFDELNDNFVMVTPHVTTIENSYSGEALETDFLGAGVYNLGFMALRVCPESTAIITWWHERLLDRCFIDKFDSIFTDQKWINYVTCFYDKGVLVSRDLGRNIAPWNYFERKVQHEDGIYYVYSRLNGGRRTPLQFAHFSGLDYKNLSITKNKNVPTLRHQEYGDLAGMFEGYSAKLQEEKIDTHFHLKYSYNTYSNGSPIISAHRRLYRRLIEMEPVANPFLADNSFYQNLKEHKLLVDANDATVDKSSPATVDGFEKKVTLINRAVLLLKGLIGFKNYIMLSKLMIRYFKPENQLFLYNKKFLRNSFRK